MFGKYVAFDVDFGPRALGVEGSGLVGVGNDGDGDQIIFYGGECEADTVDGDAALEDEIAAQRLRDADFEEPVSVPGGVEAGDLARAVDVAQDEVSAEAAAGGQGLFEVHQGSGLE